MSCDQRRLERSNDPHGYHPLHVDEDCLTDEDGREAVIAAFDRPRDWMSYLTREEHEALAKALDEIQKKISGYEYYVGEHPAKTNKRAEFARLGLFRWYAREKYNHGRQIWYGDGVPWIEH
jgi:hypothetical protein